MCSICFVGDYTMFYDSDKWFKEKKTYNSKLKEYNIINYGIKSDGKVYTREFQALIDLVHQDGGGIIVVDEGTYLIGSVFFKENVHLLIKNKGILKGSDDITDYAFIKTRIEGETCDYYAAMINADHIDGLTITGEGIIDGNGEASWRAFWNLRAKKPNCTNKEIERARIIYISNCKNVTISNITIQNSQFWSTHLYNSEHVYYEHVTIKSPSFPIKAPSTDAIDIDGCRDVHINHCYFEVNDDAVALKGGKGPYAHQAIDNYVNERILIENCKFGFCHSMLTCGSESIHSKDICVRNCVVDGASNLLWLKMRPDTKQHFEQITIENIQGKFNSFFTIHSWKQFFDLKGSTEDLTSKVNDIVFNHINIECDIYFEVEASIQYVLSDFQILNSTIKAGMSKYKEGIIKNYCLNNTNIEITNHFSGIKQSVEAD